ncbi:hypothetical protein [Streptomyces clavuligerus]|uniref:hypothetical protein n=1 Tax=Streptomyces clavuligerus TaxID=1901 RepID=UPI0001851ECB|nr:hypothetical protein [Streptomyces clavuligerus]WDN56066.1 hypothetical protein LL058_29760 [Streptomyces clavuligerus]
MAEDSTRPVREIFRRAAAAYHSELFESGGSLVLLSSGGAGSDITAAVSGGNLRLWISGIYWSEYDWGPGDPDELEQLAEDIAAVQRGDAVFFFRARDGELEFTGGRLGGHGMDLPFREELALRRTFTPWLTRTG